MVGEWLNFASMLQCDFTRRDLIDFGVWMIYSRKKVKARTYRSFVSLCCALWSLIWCVIVHLSTKQTKTFDVRQAFTCHDDFVHKGALEMFSVLLWPPYTNVGNEQLLHQGFVHFSIRPAENWTPLFSALSFISVLQGVAAKDGRNVATSAFSNTHAIWHWHYRRNNCVPFDSSSFECERICRKENRETATPLKRHSTSLSTILTSVQSHRYVDRKKWFITSRWCLVR